MEAATDGFGAPSEETVGDMSQPALRCDADDVETRLTCAHCGTPICPRCMVRTAVGLRCRDCAAPAKPRQRVRRGRAIVMVAGGLVAAAAVVLAGLGFDDESGAPREPSDIALADDSASELTAVLEDLADDDAGGIVAWVDTGEEHLGLATGHLGRGGERPLTADVAFPVANVTKLATATVALQLVEEGRLELDEPVAAMVPEAVDGFAHGDEVTLRHLLGYQSGLPSLMTDRFHAELAERLSVDDGVVTATCPQPGERMELLAYAASQPARFEPGARAEVNATDDVLLRRVVTTAADKPLGQLYDERIIDPLGLDGTWFPCAHDPRAEIARGYADPQVVHALDGHADIDADAATVDVTDFEKPLAPQANGMVSTGKDLATLMRALVAGELFEDDATLEAMREPHPLPGTGLSYGLGLQVEQNTIGHGGNRPGYAALVRYYAPEDTVIVALSNQPQNRSRGTLARRAATAIMTALTQAGS